MTLIGLIDTDLIMLSLSKISANQVNQSKSKIRANQVNQSNQCSISLFLPLDSNTALCDQGRFLQATDFLCYIA
jgi:hypothetical protein